MSVEPGEGIRDLGMTADEFRAVVFPNRDIALRFLGDEKLEEIVEVVKTNGTLSADQQGALVGALGKPGGHFLVPVFLLVHSKPESQYENLGGEFLSSAVEVILNSTRHSPEKAREDVFCALGMAKKILSGKNGKGAVMAFMKEQEGRLRQLDNAMTGIMTGFGCSPEPGG